METHGNPHGESTWINVSMVNFQCFNQHLPMEIPHQTHQFTKKTIDPSTQPKHICHGPCSPAKGAKFLATGLMDRYWKSSHIQEGFEHVFPYFPLWNHKKMGKHEKWTGFEQPCFFSIAIAIFRIQKGHNLFFLWESLGDFIDESSMTMLHIPWRIHVCMVDWC